MKKVISLMLGSIISIGLFGAKHNHTDENEVRYVKDKSELNKEYQEQLRKTQLWHNFNNNNPSWFVIFNCSIFFTSCQYSSSSCYCRSFNLCCNINDERNGEA